MFSFPLGITNAPIGEIAVKKEAKNEQHLLLSECFSRSGYPWGSKHELKRLESHPAVDTSQLHTIKIENLPTSVTEDRIRKLFETFGLIGDVYIPKPLCKTLVDAYICVFMFIFMNLHAHIYMHFYIYL